MKWWTHTLLMLAYFCVIVYGGSYIINWNIAFNEECSNCTTIECQDLDSVCGDFGLYYFKLLGVIVFIAVTLGLFFMALYHQEETEKKITKMYKEECQNDGN